jgi:hypothetical protein
MDDSQRANLAILWTLDDDKTPRPVRVRTGLSDANNTEVAGQSLGVGTKIVIGVVDAGSASSDAPSRNPFETPRPSGGDKGG